MMERLSTIPGIGAILVKEYVGVSSEVRWCRFHLRRWRKALLREP